MNIDLIPVNVLDAARQRGKSDVQIEAMNGEQLFAEYCLWHGFIGWSASLWDAVTDLQEAEKFAKGPAS